MKTLSLILLLTVMVLGGCATAPKTVPQSSVASEWQARQQALSAFEQWRLSGRAAVRQDGEGGSVSLNWSQRGADYQLAIQAPFGQGGLRITGGPYGVLVADDQGGRRFAPSADELLQSSLGWSVPVQRLRYWVVGLPAESAGDVGSIELDEQGRLRTLKDQGWRVEYDRYQAHGGIELPAKLRLENPEAQLVVKLVVDRWETLEGRP